MTQKDLICLMRVRLTRKMRTLVLTVRSYSPSHLNNINLYEEEQKNINLFKEQMVRFMLTHPELQDDIKFSKSIIGEVIENVRGKPERGASAKVASELKDNKKPYRNPMWESIANNLMQESKRAGSMPSIENFSQRLNIFRKKIEKPSVIEMILQNKDALLKQIKKEEEKKAKIQNRIHETIEAKLRKEQGDVKYYSKLKKNQFDSRMQKEEARVRQNKQTNTNQGTNLQSAQFEQKQSQLGTEQVTQGGNTSFNKIYPNGMQKSFSVQKLNQQSLQIGDNSKGIIKGKNVMSPHNTSNNNGKACFLIANQGSNNNDYSNLNDNNSYPLSKQVSLGSGLTRNNSKNLRFSTHTQQQQDYLVEKRIINSNNPIIKDNATLNARVQNENQKQFNTFKARPVPGVYERLSQDVIKKPQQIDPEIEIPIDIDFKTTKGEQLYREVRKKDDEEEIKRFVIKFLLEHRQKAEDEFKAKPSLLSQGQKYYSEESKEFSLLSPNFFAKKKMQEMIDKGTLTDDFFEHRANLEEGNVYLLTKVSKILKGNIMKKWKSIQDSKF